MLIGVPTPSVRVSKIPWGRRGTEETIRHMARFAAAAARNPRIRWCAEAAIGRDLPSKDYAGEAARLLNFVRQNVRYVQDPVGQEYVQTPEWCLFVSGQGDCDDSACLYAALASSVGHDVGFRCLKGDRSRPSEYSHVHAIVRPGRKGPWLAADTTEPLPLGVAPDHAARVTVPATCWVVDPNNGRAIRSKDLLR